MVVWGPAQGRVSPQGSPRMPMSYLPSLLSAAMRWSKVSEKYWKSAFCLCTSNPRMRFRNLLMEQSADGRVPQAMSGLPPCLPPLPSYPPPSLHPGGARQRGTHPSPRPGSRTGTNDRQGPLTAALASCLQGGRASHDCWPQAPGLPLTASISSAPGVYVCGGLPAHRGRRWHPLRGSPGAVAPCSPSGLGWW